MKKIIFPALLIGTIVIGGVLGYSIWRSSPQTAQGYVKSGKQYFEAKQYPEATIQFLNAVQKDPKDHEARYLLAECYVKQMNLNAAVKQLTTILEESSDDEQANLLLGRIYLTGGKVDSKFFKMSEDIADKLLAKSPQNVSALILKANALAGLEDHQASVDLFEQALKLDPQNSGILVGISATQAVEKNFPQAEATLLKARQMDPKNRNVLISLANLYRVTGKLGSADSMFQEAFNLDPTDRGTYLQAASFYFQTRRPELSEKILLEAQNKNPQDPSPSLTLASLYASQNRAADVTKLLLDLKQKFPKDVVVATNLADNLMPSQPAKAKVEVDEILKADPKSPYGQILLGEWQFFTGEYETAEATLSKEPVVSSPLPAPQYLLGRIADLRGNLDLAQDHYQKALEKNQNYIPARQALAELFMNKGQTADARAEVRRVLDAQPSFVPARLLKSALDTMDQRYPEAEKELTALAKEQPDNFAVHMRMGLYYETRNQQAEAEKSLLRALSLQPESPQALQALSIFYLGQKHPDRAIQIINTVPDERKKAPHYELLGLVYQQMRQPEDAINAYKKALQVDSKQSSSRGYLVAQYIQTGRLDDALQQVDELLKDGPNNASAHEMKGLIFAAKGDTAAAKQNYERALNINPNRFVSANNLANILSDEGGNMEVALKWAQTARRTSPNDPAAADTLGWIQHKLGQNILARDQLQFAVSKQPLNPIYQYHLGVIYKDTKQPREAEVALKKSLNSQFPFNYKNEAQAALAELGKKP